jgi:hypothetical protein
MLVDRREAAAATMTYGMLIDECGVARGRHLLSTPVPPSTVDPDDATAAVPDSEAAVPKPLERPHYHPSV